MGNIVEGGSKIATPLRKEKVAVKMAKNSPKTKVKTKGISCPICGKELIGEGKVTSIKMKHMHTEHRDIVKAWGDKGRDTQRLLREQNSHKQPPEQPLQPSKQPQQPLEEKSVSSEKPKEEAKAKGNGFKVAATPEEANVIIVSPRKFEISSTLLWQAKQVCEKVWGWPEYSLEDWLDTFIWWSFRQRGIILGAYQILEEDKHGAGS